MIFHAITGAFDHNSLGVVKKTVKDGGGEGGVIVEKGGPLFEGLVGGEQDGSALIPFADDLEKQIGALFIDGQEPYFVEDQKTRDEIGAQLLFEADDGQQGLGLGG